MDKSLQPTKQQHKILLRMCVGGEYSAHMVGASVTTMDALVKKGFLVCDDRTPAGHILNSRTAIKYTRIK